VAQSAVYGNYARTGGAVKNEEDPLDEMRESAAAFRHLEEAVLGADWMEGIVLRYGALYGPGTSLAPGEEQFELVRERKFPLIGNGAGVWSFIHIADAAEATLAAVEHDGRASTTLWTTTRRPSRSGCRRWHGCSARRSRCGCRGSSGGCSRARLARCS
jgi:nucleoside-diphosphate-sugar epimerase